MKYIIIFLATLIFSTSTFAEKGNPVSHKHGNRAHSHSLPKTGINHSHNSGKKYRPSISNTGGRYFELKGIKEKIHLRNLGRFTSWRCYDFSDYRQKNIIVEVLNFYSKSLNDSGIVLFDGGNTGRSTNYTRAGLNHRWDFENGKYALIIKPDGTGLYYDFSRKDKGVKPSQLFKCKK